MNGPRTLLLSLLFLLCITHAFSTFNPDPNIVIVYSDTLSNAQDVQNQLLTFFPNVDLYDAGANTPSTSALDEYDAFLVYSSQAFHNNTALGNVLAHYINFGKGVVVAGAALSNSSSLQIGGSFLGTSWFNTYYTVQPGSAEVAGAHSLVPIFSESSLLNSVNSFTTLNQSVVYDVYPHFGSFEIAKYQDGTPLAVSKTLFGGKRRVDLNFYPPSQAAVGLSSWDGSTDGTRLLVNSLLYVLGVTYDFPIITETKPALTATTQGGGKLTIYGFGFESFHFTFTIWIDVFQCANVTFKNPFEITCIIPAGIGRDVPISIDLNWKPSAMRSEEEREVRDVRTSLTPITVATPATFSWPAPTITAVYYDIADTLGGTPVTIIGTNFGLPNVNGAYREVFVKEAAGSNYFWNDTIVIFSAPHGTGKLNNLIPNINGWTTAVYADFTYKSPFVTSVAPGYDVHSKEHITITGKYFGGLDPYVHRAIHLGDSLCWDPKIISDQQLTCWANGRGIDQPIAITVNGLSNDVFFTASVDFADPFSEGLKCLPPFGSQDRLQPSRCNCWSGYASSNVLGNDCEIHATCPPLVTYDLSEGHIYAPNPPITKFERDTLFVFQSVPVVANRRGANIAFVLPKLAQYTVNGTWAGEHGMLTCGYPGALWTKTVNQLDCLDEYRAELPWSQAQTCGFTEDPTASSPTQIIFKSDLVNKYYEVFNHHGVNIKVTQSTTYLVTVSFTRMVTILAKQPVTVTIVDPTDDWLHVELIYDTVYDPANEIVYVKFRTTALWPYALDVALIAGTQWISSSNPQITDSAVGVASITQEQALYEEVNCLLKQDTPCVQQWYAAIATDGLCNIQGAFQMTDRVICRDEFITETNQPGAGCNFTGHGTAAPDALFQFEIGTTALCAEPTLDTSKDMWFSLDSFFDRDYFNPTTVFQTGDMIYFLFTVTNPVVSIDTVAFNQISILGSDGVTVADVIYQVPEAFNLGEWLSDIDAETINEIHELLPAGEHGHLRFGFRLHRGKLQSILPFLTNDETQTTLTVRVIADILYHGNQKRSTSDDASSRATATVQKEATLTIVQADETNDNVAKDNLDSVNSLTDSASSIVPSAILALLAALLLM